MKIVVTGAEGFIGKNLCIRLQELGYNDLVKIDRATPEEALLLALNDADFVYHLAGVNRPKDDAEFNVGNANLTALIVNQLEKAKRNASVMISSSIQADRDNSYGISKALAEKEVENYSCRTGADCFIYRFSNVFGKWCKPNYNSFIATFCHNIVSNIEINIHDSLASVKLIYIDDVCNELISLLDGKHPSGLNFVTPEYSTTVGEVANLLYSFKESRQSLITSHVGIGLTRALYSTYLSYFTPEQFSYSIPSYGDERGVFCEMLKTKESGQFSFFTAYPGVTRGGHYHHSKNEKFLVIKGQALFKFEQIFTGERYELHVKSEQPKIVETVPGWSHDITNIGDDELVVMLWANEIFDRKSPDTIARPL